MEITKVKLEDLIVDENSRANADLSELMESIKEEGLKQPVIIANNFRNKRSKKKVLVAGFRRYHAMKALGLTTIEAVLDTSVQTEADFLIVNITENLQRKDLSQFELGRYIYELSDVHGLTKSEIRVRLGISATKVSSLLSAYSKTPAEFQDKILYDGRVASRKVGTIPLTTAVAINNLSKSNYINAEQKKKLYKMASTHAVTDSLVKQVGKQIKNGKSFNQALKKAKNTHTYHIAVTLKEEEVNKLKHGDITKKIKQLVYGEATGYFSRPD